MHILLTRPLEDCSEMIIKFKSLGHQVSHLPLLNIEKIDYERINFSDYKKAFCFSTDAPFRETNSLLNLKFNLRSFIDEDVIFNLSSLKVFL